MNTPDNEPDNIEENSAQYAKDDSSDKEMSDLTDRGTMYLLEERIENLREAIGLTLDETLELRQLESFLKLHEDNKEAISEGLGVPSKEDQFIAAMEAKRVNRYDDAEYDGGGIDEEDEQSESSVNQYYQKLLKESRLNLKSIALLSPDRKPIFHTTQNGKNRPLTLFDLYETLPPKCTFTEYLAKLWKSSESQATEEFQKMSEGKQYAFREKWQKYLEDRTVNAPSPFQKVLFRCQDFVTSPIYDGEEEVKEDHYRLQCGAELRFTDKTIVFTLPFSEFEDIPKKDQMFQPVGFMEVSFILPEYAHEKKRFFKKNGTVEEFSTYIKHLGVELTEKQTQFLSDLAKTGSLRLYHEVLELPDRNEIRGYFLNIRKGYEIYPPRYIKKCIRDRFTQEEFIVIRQVEQFYAWFPEWMRKIGGLIIEEKDGKPVSIQKPLQIAVDYQLPEYSVRREPLFIPSWRLAAENIQPDTWQVLYVAEMRAAYKTNPNAFKKYAQDLEMKRIELRCSCDNHGTPHKEKCPVPVLEEILKKIREDGKKVEQATKKQPV